MYLAKILLRLEYPLLRFLKFREVSGIYTKYGQDILLLQILYNYLVNSDSVYGVEINRPVRQKYSIANIFLKLFAGTAFLINTDVKKALLCTLNDPKSINFPIENIGNYELELGLDVSLVQKNYLYKYSSSSNLVELLANCTLSYSLIVLSYNEDAISLMLELIKKTSTKAVLIQNNCADFFRLGDNQIRKKLAKQGYVYHSRFDNCDDLFISSEMLNGFPSNLFEKIESDSLVKWISEPPNSDYTRPR